MSNVFLLKGGDFDVTEVAKKAAESGVQEGIIVGFDKDGLLYYQGFGACSRERCVFLMEGVKADIFKVGAPR